VSEAGEELYLTKLFQGGEELWLNETEGGKNCGETKLFEGGVELWLHETV
jgi:hypothetical protein